MKKYQKPSYQKKQQTMIQRFHSQPVWQSSPQKLKTEQKSKSQDSSIKVLYEVINLTNSDSESSQDELTNKTRILDKKKVDVNNMCREIIMSVIDNTNNKV